MVLPGIQALFGFQLIAVFNARFSEKLTAAEQRLHLGAIGLTAIAIGLIMAPAAVHRQTSPREVTDSFIRLSTRLLLLSMLPLALSICVEFFLVARIILGTAPVPALLSACLLAFLLVMWFVLPRRKLYRRQDAAMIDAFRRDNHESSST